MTSAHRPLANPNSPRHTASRRNRFIELRMPYPPSKATGSRCRPSIPKAETVKNSRPVALNRPTSHFPGAISRSRRVAIAGKRSGSQDISEPVQPLVSAPQACFPVLSWAYRCARFRPKVSTADATEPLASQGLWQRHPYQARAWYGQTKTFDNQGNCCGKGRAPPRRPLARTRERPRALVGAPPRRDCRGKSPSRGRSARGRASHRGSLALSKPAGKSSTGR